MDMACFTPGTGKSGGVAVIRIVAVTINPEWAVIGGMARVADLILYLGRRTLRRWTYRNYSSTIGRRRRSDWRRQLG